MRGLRLLVLACVPVLFAACVDEADEPRDPPTDGEEVIVDPRTGEERIIQRLPLAFDAEPYAHEEDVVGHFDIQEHGFPVGTAQRSAGLDPGNHHIYDVSDKVPVGVPVRIVLEVDADLDRGDLDIWFAMPNDEIWTSQFDTPYGGYSKVTLVVVRTSGDPVEAVVRYDEYDTSQGFDYTLTLRVVSDPSLLMAGVPVVVPVPEEALGLELEWQEGMPERVWLWDGVDAVVETTAPADGRWNHTFSGGGDHVLLLPQGSGAANATLVSTRDPERMSRPVALGLLEQAITQTDPVAFAADASGAADFDVARQPIQVGFQVDVDRITNGFEGRLVGPGGTLLDVSFSDDLPFYSASASGRMSFTFLTSIGDAKLAPGPHTAHFAGDPNGAGEISAWIVHYART